jgi:acetyl-CoA carboxylase biotin carboxylase subunit
VFESILVANRGEIARRIFRTARAVGARGLAVYSEADADLPFVAEADAAMLIGEAPAARSYLDAARILDAARALDAAAVHPGYGFLSEDPRFAQAVVDSGLAWIGPSPTVIEAMGDKTNARNIMRRAGVPVAAGTDESIVEAPDALAAAAEIGYPVMVKATAGGGGMGMAVAHDASELLQAFETAQTRSERLFGSRSMLVERYVGRARHVEVQLLGTRDGEIIALGERDCSVQRRHQKIVEETPSPGLDEAARASVIAAGIRAAEAVGYEGAGTAEFLFDVDSGEFVFLEMNTRLQVEHPVTELVFGLDLVEEQVRVASGAAPTAAALAPRACGHSIELRVYAEDPVRFLPSPGGISRWEEPRGEGVRVDAGYACGNAVTPHYDPLLAKICVWGADRREALARARRAVDEFAIAGPRTNLPFLAALLASEQFASGRYDTNVVADVQAGPVPTTTARS